MCKLGGKVLAIWRISFSRYMATYFFPLISGPAVTASAVLAERVVASLFLLEDWHMMVCVNLYQEMMHKDRRTEGGDGEPCEDKGGGTRYDNEKMQ